MDAGGTITDSVPSQSERIYGEQGKEGIVISQNVPGEK